MKEMWTTRLSGLSMMTPRFLADFVGTIAKDPKLILMLGYMEGLVRETRTSVLVEDVKEIRQRDRQKCY